MLLPTSFATSMLAWGMLTFGDVSGPLIARDVKSPVWRAVHAQPADASTHLLSSSVAPFHDWQQLEAIRWDSLPLCARTSAEVLTLSQVAA